MKKITTIILKISTFILCFISGMGAVNAAIKEVDSEYFDLWNLSNYTNNDSIVNLASSSSAYCKYQKYFFTENATRDKYINYDISVETRIVVDSPSQYGKFSTFVKTSDGAYQYCNLEGKCSDSNNIVTRSDSSQMNYIKKGEYYLFWPVSLVTYNETTGRYPFYNSGKKLKMIGNQSTYSNSKLYAGYYNGCTTEDCVNNDSSNNSVGFYNEQLVKLKNTGYPSQLCPPYIMVDVTHVNSQEKGATYTLAEKDYGLLYFYHNFDTALAIYNDYYNTRVGTGMTSIANKADNFLEPHIYSTYDSSYYNANLSWYTEILPLVEVDGETANVDTMPSPKKWQWQYSSNPSQEPDYTEEQAYLTNINQMWRSVTDKIDAFKAGNTTYKSDNTNLVNAPAYYAKCYDYIAGKTSVIAETQEEVKLRYAVDSLMKNIALRDYGDSSLKYSANILRSYFDVNNTDKEPSYLTVKMPQIICGKITNDYKEELEQKRTTLNCESKTLTTEEKATCDDLGKQLDTIDEVLAEFQIIMQQPGDSIPLNCDSFGDVIFDIFKLLMIIAPILVVVLGTVDFAKATLASDEAALKKAGSNFGKRIIAAVILFLLPTILSLILNLAYSAGILEKPSMDPLCKEKIYK